MFSIEPRFGEIRRICAIQGGDLIQRQAEADRLCQQYRDDGFQTSYSRNSKGRKASGRQEPNAENFDTKVVVFHDADDSFCGKGAGGVMKAGVIVHDIVDLLEHPPEIERINIFA